MSARLPKQEGEWINRSKTVKFSFEGQDYIGYEGDTISSALWAAGVKVLGRSFKYHRPRGILSMANHDVNVMVTDGLDTNIRGDVVQVTDGMNLLAVNTDGGVLKDKSRVIDSISPLLPVGFYYKAFHTPRRLFPFWENIIRKAAGLGVVNFNYPRILKKKMNRHCDLLIIGAGPSGLSAALAAAVAGLEVIVVDENAMAGGTLGYDHAGTLEASQYLDELLPMVQQHPDIQLITGAYAAGYYTDHLVPVVTQEGIIKVRAKSVIVATGVFEQAPVFRYNDLPGVMLGSAAQRLMHRYGVKPFENGIVMTANSHGYRVALDLVRAGVKVLALVDMRPSGEPSKLSEEVRAAGVEIHSGCCVYEALPTSGMHGVKGAVICRYDVARSEADRLSSFTIECDGIAMSAGWAPAAALLYQAGTAMRYDDVIHQFVPSRLPAGVFAAGRVNGVYELERRMMDGARAASDVLKFLGKEGASIEIDAEVESSPSHPYPIVPHPKGKNFIDFDEDIQLKDFINAAKEGFDNIELMKRFTTVGMGPSQGKHSNMNAIRILARVRSLSVDKIGTTTARPFFHPTPIGHLAGRGLHPHRLTSLHALHVAADGEIMDAGAWQRPAYYRKPGLQARDCVFEEVQAVRELAGMIDTSTLGKIEIRGADASSFLERFYTGSFASMEVGSSRYAMLIDESGVVADDGVAVRIAKDFYYVSTNTSNAAAVYREMQRCVQMWQLSVLLVNVTGAYAAMNLAGPKSREILSKITTFDLTEKSFPAGAYREMEVAGVKARVLRVAFVSDLAFEVHVPSAAAPHVWTAIMSAGQPYGLRPFGTDAQRLLRLEMGHPLISHDTDGLTNPFEMRHDWAIHMSKPFFTGKRSLEILSKRPVRKMLVPFVLAEDYSGEVPNECNLVIDGPDIKGRVTSIAFSKTVGRYIGMAYVSPTSSKVGSTFNIKTDGGQMVTAAVAKAPFVQSLKG